MLVSELPLFKLWIQRRIRVLDGRFLDVTVIYAADGCTG